MDYEDYEIEKISMSCCLEHFCERFHDLIAQIEYLESRLEVYKSLKTYNQLNFLLGKFDRILNKIDELCLLDRFEDMMSIVDGNYITSNNDFLERFNIWKQQ